jgi:hypothetical protein
MKDCRLKRRLISVIEQLNKQPNASVPKACANWASTKGAYRLWDNDKFAAQEIIQAHQLSTIERLKEKDIVLAIQATTELDFTHHPKT